MTPALPRSQARRTGERRPGVFVGGLLGINLGQPLEKALITLVGSRLRHKFDLVPGNPDS